MRFEWDEAKNAQNIRKHGIDFMNAAGRSNFMNRKSKTDWQRMAEEDDERIDTCDIPELDETFFEKAELRVPAKQPVTLRIDEDVLAWFKSQGKGYQTRINKLLRQYMDSQVHRR